MENEDILLARTAAKYLKKSYWKILEMAKAGEIPHCRIGNRLIFRKSTLDRWMTSLELASVKKEPDIGKIRKLKE